jgi:hypothetical protein
MPLREIETYLPCNSLISSRSSGNSARCADVGTTSPHRHYSDWEDSLSHPVLAADVGTTSPHLSPSQFHRFYNEVMSPAKNYTYDDAIQAAIDDGRTYVETPYTSALGLNIVRVVGSLSAISSAVIIIIILRSESKLSTVYHRILLMMSISDIVTSTAMALTTLPMPKDMIYTQFEGTSIGSTFTCELQGFFYIIGASSTMTYNVILCIYYLCSIRYGYTEVEFQRCLEPILHCLNFVFSGTNAIIQFAGDLFNPSPYNAWCATDTYPYYCLMGYEKVDDSCLLIRDGLFTNKPLRKFLWSFTVIGTLVGFITISYSIIAISCRVYSQEKLLQKNNDLDKSIRIKIGDNSGQQSQQDHENDSIPSDVRPAEEDDARMRNDSAKVVLIQGFAYVLAFLICQYNVIIGSIMRRYGNTSGIAHMVARPSQGIFNLIIFIGHKVYNSRRSEKISLSKAIRKVFDNGYDTPLTVSNIAMITQHYDDSAFVDDIPFKGNQKRLAASNAEDRKKEVEMKSKKSFSDVSSGMGSKRQQSGVQQGSHRSDSQSQFHDRSMQSFSYWNSSPSIGVLSSTGISYAPSKESSRRGVSFSVDEADLSCSAALDPITREQDREC